MPISPIIWDQMTLIAHGWRKHVPSRATDLILSMKILPSGLFDKKGKRKSTWGRDVDDRERPLPADRGYSPQKPLARFPSEWNFDGQSLGTRKKRKRPPGSGIYTVKQKTRSAKASSSHPNASVHSSDKLGASRFPLEIDRDGHVRGAVVLGSRQKLHSKN